jgi:hypothetical protein
MDVFSMELGIRLSFVKTSEFRRGPNTLPNQNLACPTIYNKHTNTTFITNHKAVLEIEHVSISIPSKYEFLLQAMTIQHPSPQ